MLTILQCTNTTSVISKWGTSSPFSSLGDIQKVRSLKIPEFWTPLTPCLSLFVLEHLSPQGTCSFWLELPLSPSISILVKFREKKLMSTSISLVELNLIFKKPQWNLYKVDTIGAWQMCLLYGCRKRSHAIHWQDWIF